MTPAPGSALAGPTQTSHTGVTPTPGETAMGIDTRTTTTPADTGRDGGNRVTMLLVIAALLLAAGGLWLLLRPTPAPADTPLVSTPTASAIPSASASVPTQTTSPEQAAYTAAETSYRAWSDAVIAATSGNAPGLLTTAPATPLVIAAQSATITSLWKGWAGSIPKSVTVRAITPVSYTPTTVKLSVCALRDTRFIDPTGRDVTVDRDGNPSPPTTKPLAQTVGFILDGTTWRVSEYVIDPTDGVPC
jgi:hypothetical protein